MKFLCPFCNSAIAIDDSYRGFKAACSGCGKAFVVPEKPFAAGRIIGDFAIRSKLGEGSIGSVYKAFQISLERIVALKVLSPQYMTQKGTAEFLREARAAARLQHTNLVQSYAVGVDDGVCYMAMTYITGETLKARIKRDGRIPYDEALHIIQQVAEALHYAWTESRIIHRDVKPDNIMLSENGIVKLTDLGLAINQSEWTAEMDISGSPSYMSPEQFAGEKLDTRSDIYSLGVTLYQMLTGALPYDSETIRSLAHQHFEATIPDPAKLVPEIPARITSLLKRMMAKMPEKRFKNMEALLREIWAIRQKTAPNKEMVPDVHTISMKRLDYGVQVASLLGDDGAADDKKAVSVVSESHSPKMIGAVISAVFVGAVLCLLTGIWLGRSESSGDAVTGTEQEMQSRGAFFSAIHSFDKQLGQIPSAPPEEIKADGDALLVQIAGMDDTAEMHALSALVARMIKMNTEMREQEKAVRETIAGLQAEVTARQQNIAVLQAERDEAVRKLAETSGQAGAAPAPESAVQKELERLKLKLAELEQINGRNEHSLEELRQLEERNVSKLMFARLCLGRECSDSWENYEFHACREAIGFTEALFPSLKEWCAELNRLNTVAESLHRDLTVSGPAFNMKRFGTGKKVIQIQKGVVQYMDSTGKLQETAWKNLTPDEAWSIVGSEKETGSGYVKEEVYAVFELMQGRQGKACAAAPGLSVIQDVADAAAGYKAYLIRNKFDPQNRKGYDKLLADFISRFEGVPSFAVLKNELEAVPLEQTAKEKIEKTEKTIRTPKSRSGASASQSNNNIPERNSENEQ